MSLRVSASVRRFLYSPSIGTNACENAPSANRRRNRLGMRKATKNASVAAPAPKTQATSISRTNPRIRETRVMLLTVASALSRFMEGYVTRRARLRLRFHKRCSRRDLRGGRVRQELQEYRCFPCNIHKISVSFRAFEAPVD